MYSCIICGIQLSESKLAEEHIFLKAFGDELTSTRLVCKDCNSLLGQYVDGPVVNLSKNWTNWLGISGRAKGKALVHENTTDKDYYFDPKTNSYTLTHRRVNPPIQNGKKVTLSGEFPNQADFDKYAQSMRKKYPNATFGPAQIENKPIEKPEITVSIPIDLYAAALESIKMATEFALFCGTPRKALMFPLYILRQSLEMLDNNQEPKGDERLRNLIEIIAHPVHPKVPASKKIDLNTHAKLFTDKGELYCIVFFARLFCFKVQLSSSVYCQVSLERTIFYDGSVLEFKHKYGY